MGGMIDPLILIGMNKSEITGPDWSDYYWWFVALLVEVTQATAHTTVRVVWRVGRCIGRNMSRLRYHLL